MGFYWLYSRDPTQFNNHVYHLRLLAKLLLIGDTFNLYHGAKQCLTICEILGCALVGAGSVDTVINTGYTRGSTVTIIGKAVIMDVYGSYSHHSPKDKSAHNTLKGNDFIQHFPPVQPNSEFHKEEILLSWRQFARLLSPSRLWRTADRVVWDGTLWEQDGNTVNF